MTFVVTAFKLAAIFAVHYAQLESADPAEHTQVFQNKSPH